MRKIPQPAIDIVKRFEGCELKPYMDVGGKKTIGWGHCGPDVDGEITQQQADDLLETDISKVGKQVLDLVKVPLSDNQFSALISFTFNLGVEKLKKSTLLNRLNLGLYSSVPGELLKWTHVNGTQVQGLMNRRVAEAALWDRAESA